MSLISSQEELPAGGPVLQRTNTEQRITASRLHLRESTRYVNTCVYSL